MSPDRGCAQVRRRVQAHHRQSSCDARHRRASAALRNRDADHHRKALCHILRRRTAQRERARAPHPARPSQHHAGADRQRSRALTGSVNGPPVRARRGRDSASTPVSCVCWPHSPTRILASAISLPHLARSDAMKAANSAAVEPTVSATRPVNRSRRSGSLQIVRVSASISVADGLGSARAHADARERYGIETRQRVRHRHELRRQRIAFERGDADRLDAASARLVDDRGDVVEHQIGLLPNEIVERRRAAAVVHGRPLDPGHALEELGREMHRGADAGRGAVELSRIGLGSRRSAPERS